MTPPTVLDTVLLIALPASGKSEVRRYLRLLDPAERVADFHLGDQVQLDDFPYVHFVRVADQALEEMGQPRRFFANGEGTFLDKRDWGSLLRLVNEDYAVVTDPRAPVPPASAAALLERIDRARAAVGAPPAFEPLGGGLAGELAARLEGEAGRLHTELFGSRPDSLDGKTVVIEFARGGPDGSSMPLPPPHGYRYSFGQLSPAILERASVLYVWVTPEESRRKNIARADPNDPGSVLHHSVPLPVMLEEYGCDDIDWLLANAATPGHVEVQAHGRRYQLPLARFDNRTDCTSFVRDDPAQWPAPPRRALHEGLAQALGQLYRAGRVRR